MLMTQFYKSINIVNVFRISQAEFLFIPAIIMLSAKQASLKKKSLSARKLIKH